MITKETLEGKTAEQVARILADAKAKRTAAVTEANAAINAYQTAVKERNANLKKMTGDLQKQIAGITGKAEALKTAMLKATATGNSAELDRIQRTMDDMEAQRSKLGARLETLSGKPPRCDKAYEAMNAAVARAEEAEEEYGADARVIREFCEEVIRRWEGIVSSLRLYASVHRSGLERARDHYSSER